MNVIRPRPTKKSVLLLSLLNHVNNRLDTISLKKSKFKIIILTSIVIKLLFQFCESMTYKAIFRPKRESKVDVRK